MSSSLSSTGVSPLSALPQVKTHRLRRVAYLYHWRTTPPTSERVRSKPVTLHHGVAPANTGSIEVVATSYQYYADRVRVLGAGRFPVF